MTDEKKIKDLLARMVAMSPTPPTYPEEIEMAQRPQSPRRSPALILAVSAAAVLALALPLLLFQGGGEEPAVTTVPAPATTAPSTPTTDPAVTTTQPPATSTTTPEALITLEWPVFLVQDPGNSFIGNPAIAPFLLPLMGMPDEGLTGSPIDVLVNLDQLDVVLPDGWSTVVPPGVEIVEQTFEMTEEGLNRTTLDMNEAFLEGAGGLLADITMLNQLIYTVSQYDIDEVLFTFGGEPIEAFGSEGLSLVEPVNGGTFIDDLNPIFVTGPVVVGGDGLPQVAGWANVFEAALVVQIVDANTGVVEYEEPVMATCGTGCWGSFNLGLDTPVIDVGDHVLVFWYSAEDGEPADVVTIPVGTSGP
jgi:Immunoglobulin-like domain of bacterial spore germination